MVNPELKAAMNKIRMHPSKKYFRGFLLIRPEKSALAEDHRTEILKS